MCRLQTSRSITLTSHAAKLAYNPWKPLTGQTILESAWELRFGPDNRFRVLYRVNVSRREVHVLAIGLKKGSSLFIGGLEVKL